MALNSMGRVRTLTTKEGDLAVSAGCNNTVPFGVFIDA